MRTLILIIIIINIFTFIKAQSTISYSYDTQGRLVAENYQSKYQLSFVYDIEGNFTNKTVTNIGVTGIGDINIASTTNIQVYPNPAKDKINIQTNNPEHKISEIIITDVSGRCLYSEKPNCFLKQINIDYLKEGIYLLGVRTKNELEIIKFVKK